MHVMVIYLWVFVMQLGRALGREWLHQTEKVGVHVSNVHMRFLHVVCVYWSFFLICYTTILTVCRTICGCYCCFRTAALGEAGICGMLLNPMFGTGGYIRDAQGHYVDPAAAPHFPLFVSDLAHWLQDHWRVSA